MEDCEKISLALLYSWVGDSKEAREVSKKCIENLRDSVLKIREKIKEVKSRVNEEYLLPKALREEGIESEDLVKLALYELSRRIFNFSGGILEVEQYNGIKYIVIKSGYKSVIKGFCETCKGYNIKKLDNGYLIQLEGIVYGEILGSITKEDLIKLFRELK